MTPTSFTPLIRHRKPGALGSRVFRGVDSGSKPALGNKVKAGDRAFQGRLWILLLTALALALAASGSPAEAAHGDRAWAQQRAYELADAARHAHRLSEDRIHYPTRAEERLLARFHDFEEEAERFHRQASRSGDTYLVERAFRRLVEDYWELRAAFRHFHGSHQVRSAFHRINEPMEGLYEYYVGGNLYRDDPRIRHRRRLSPRHATPLP